MKTCEFRRDSYIYIIIFLISQSMKTLVSIPNITVNIIEVTRHPFCNNQDWISFFILIRGTKIFIFVSHSLLLAIPMGHWRYNGRNGNLNSRLWGTGVYCTYDRSTQCAQWRTKRSLKCTELKASLCDNGRLHGIKDGS